MSFLFGFCGDAGAVTKTTVQPNTQNRSLLNANGNSSSYDESLLSSKDEEITKLSRQNESLKKQLTDLEMELEQNKQKYSECDAQSQQLQDQIVMYKSVN